MILIVFQFKRRLAEYLNTMRRVPFIAAALIITVSGSVYADSEYLIQKGDTLYSLSKKYDVSVQQLMEYNHIENASRIYPGIKILIPSGYTVKKGDTFYGIARKHNISLEELLSSNELKISDVLYPGQILAIPAGSLSDEKTVVIAQKPENGGSEGSAVETADEPDKAEINVLWPHTGARAPLDGKLKGIQISGNPGDSITAVSSGTVVWADDYGMYKFLILVESDNGLVYGYGGNEKSTVKVGDRIISGSSIGILGGADGKADAYFFVYKNGKPMDPSTAPRV